MGGRGGRDRHGRALVTLAALALLGGGSWLLASITTASARSPRTPTTPPSLRAAPPTVTPVTVPGASPVSAGPVPAGPVPAVSPPTSPGPVASPVPVTSPPPRPAPLTAPGSPSPVSAAAVPAGEPAGSAPVAAALILAVNLQSGRKPSIPVTPTNVSLLQRWMANEGGLWANNPLNTSLGAAVLPHQFTSGGQDSGIPIFSSLSAGVAATATTLLSDPRYARILRVLARGTASCTTFATAVIRSPWASGHYGHSASGFCSGTVTPPPRTGPHHHGSASVTRPARHHRR
jgi:hypothetical protein